MRKPFSILQNRNRVQDFPQDIHISHRSVAAAVSVKVKPECLKSGFQELFIQNRQDLPVIFPHGSAKAMHQDDERSLRPFLIQLSPKHQAIPDDFDLSSGHICSSSKSAISMTISTSPG